MRVRPLPDALTIQALLSAMRAAIGLHSLAGRGFRGMASLRMMSPGVFTKRMSPNMNKCDITGLHSMLTCVSETV